LTGFSYQPTKIVLRRPLESAQCVSIRYTERLAEARVEPSVGSVGDSYDKALAETINALYKAGVIHRRGPWRSFEAVEFATLEWVDWFNNRRLLEPIGNIPPAEAEERYYAMTGSTTTRGQHVSCDIDTGCVAFCWTENSAPNLSYAAQYLACALPCERLTSALAGSRASLGAGAVRYSVTVTDRLPFAGLLAKRHPSSATETANDGLRKS